MVTSRDDQATPPPEWPEVRPPKANAPPPVDEEPWYRSLAHYAGLVLASMLGCLIRLGLDALANCMSTHTELLLPAIPSA